MRVALLTYGSRGEVQPFVCLGRALADRGHDVEVVTTENGGPMARSAGLSFRSLPRQTARKRRAREGRRRLAKDLSMGSLRFASEGEEAEAAEMRRVLIDTAESADLFICSLLLEARCRVIARAKGIAIVPLHICPVIPSRSYVCALLPQRNLGPFNRLSHEIFFRMVYRVQRNDFAALHRELNLPAPTWSEWRVGLSGEAPCLLGYSQMLFPAPADWSGNLYPVGFLEPWPDLRESFGEVGIPPELEDWLDSGPPPVFFSFGTAPVDDPQALLDAIRKALADLGARGVLAADRHRLNTAGDDTLFLVGGVDHQSLLPRCAAAVHHGGSGSTMASARAGVPTLVCWRFGDHSFWGERCRRLGIGHSIPFAKLDARHLAQGLRKVLDPAMARRAEDVSRQMAHEHGVESAVACIEQDWSHFRTVPSISS
jgi:sterol 3beta-glucosyltransferase